MIHHRIVVFRVRVGAILPFPWNLG
jgi:hypothetical protein